MIRRLLSLSVASIVSLSALAAEASTGTCDVSAGDTGASELACLAAVTALGTNTVVDDVFRDANGKTADQLPLYGKLSNAFPGCSTANNTCNGDLSSNPGVPWVNCQNNSRDFATVASYVDALDWRYANPIRMHDGHGSVGACPDWGSQVVDGDTDGYHPWEGMVFDLGGPANKVALFAINDHGPQPCESVEYTAYLTDDPSSRDVIDDPTTVGADPSKWNRAKLSQIYLEGWQKVRAADDPGLSYSIEADSFTTVWSLPCGITFRYVGFSAGNDGHDLPACQFDSYDAEIDAVAGLTEQGAGVCPDADQDHYVDCACSGAPAVCDCNDADPTVHPGAAEPCDAPDLDCDGNVGACAGNLVCFASACVATCSGTGEFSSCPPGATCTLTDVARLCVPDDCTTGACPAGSVCDAATKQCKPACAAVVCPASQVCSDGRCIDPCANLPCPNQQVCDLGVCRPRCDCFHGDVGCVAPSVCDRRPEAICVAPSCVGVDCGAGKHCDDTGACAGDCDGVACPAGQKCVVTLGGCVGLCADVTCSDELTCDPQTGQCIDDRCQGVQCFAPAVCAAGQCVLPEGGAGDASVDGSGGAGGSHVSTASGYDTGSGSGCGCRVAPSGPGAAGGALGALAAMGALALRRRRRG